MFCRGQHSRLNFTVAITASEDAMNELEIIHYRQLEGLRVFFDTVDYRTSHVHSEWELIWVLDNPLSVNNSQCKFIVQPGEMVLLGPNIPHEFHKLEQESTFLCFQISAGILPSLPPMAMDANTPHSYLSTSEMQLLKKRLAGIAEAYLVCAENYELYCVGESCLVLHLLLSRLPHRILSPEEADGLSKRNERLKRLIDFVDANYMHKIKLEDFAESEGCSLSYLSRFIKETMNQSFQEYVASVRFNCACKLINTGGMRMLDVCLESGFSDYRYFSRAFKQQYNMTPEEYSQSKRKMQLEAHQVHHSLHSVERFYSREDSLKLLKKYVL